MESNRVAYTARDGRRFGLTVGIAFLVLAGILAWRGHGGGVRVLGGIGGALALGGLIVPRALRTIDAGWMKFALVLSKVTTPIFMGIVYYLCFTPMGLVRRILGKNSLKHRGETSVWADHNSVTDLRRQF